MIARSIRSAIEQGLQERTAVILSGLPRVGRTCLVEALATDADAIFIDAADRNGRRKIQKPDSIGGKIAGNLVIIDNVDDQVRAAVSSLVRAVSPTSPQTRFLLLPRRPALASHLAQELVGLVRSVELGPIQPDEAYAGAISTTPSRPSTEAEVSSSPASQWNQDLHWLRGGLPNSFYSDNDEESFRWRIDYVNALLGGDFRDWGIDAIDRLRDVVGLIARGQGQIFKEETYCGELRIKRESLNRTIDRLIKLGLIRILPNIIGQSSVLYIRDSGILHAIHGIRTVEQLRTDKNCGHSWQGFATEALISSTVGASAEPRFWFFRDKNDNEIDLIADFRPLLHEVWALEIKFDEERGVSQRFWRACETVKPTRKLLVHGGQKLRQQNGIEHVPLLSAIDELRTICQRSGEGISS